MGTTATIPREVAKQLTNKELVALATLAGADDIPGGPKDTLLDIVLEHATDEQIVKALKDGSYEIPDGDTPPATSTASSDKGTTSNAKPKTAPASDDLEALLDTDDELPGVEPEAESELVYEFEESQLPKLAKLGARVRKVEKTTPDRGEQIGSWWCPWTDFSKVRIDDGIDQMPQSKAIRVGDYAVVLPPQGVKASQLRK